LPFSRRRHGLRPRLDLAVEEKQVGRRVVVDHMPALLRLERQHERRIAVDIDARYVIHLERDTQSHCASPS